MRNNGTITSITFSRPQGSTVDLNGNIYVAHSGKVVKIDTYGNITTIANVDSYDVYLDNNGYLYWADNSDLSIRRLAPDGGLKYISYLVVQRLGKGVFTNGIAQIAMWNNHLYAAQYSTGGNIKRVPPYTSIC